MPIKVGRGESGVWSSPSTSLGTMESLRISTSLTSASTRPLYVRRFLGSSTILANASQARKGSVLSSDPAQISSSIADASEARRQSRPSRSPGARKEFAKLFRQIARSDGTATARGQP